MEYLICRRWPLSVISDSYSNKKSPGQNEQNSESLDLSHKCGGRDGVVYPLAF
jgi:hypothetical protein